MTRQFHATLAVSLILSLGIAAADAASLPTRVGTCATSTVKQVSTRLADGKTGQPIPDSGSVVQFANNGVQISYDSVPPIEQSHVGDKVLICLVQLPQHCPPGDARGKIYTTTNLRTLQSWTLPDSQHSCGGA